MAINDDRAHTHKTVSVSLYASHFEMLDKLTVFWRYGSRSSSIRRAIEDAYNSELKKLNEDIKRDKL